MLQTKYSPKINRNSVIRASFFLFTLIAITFKCILFLGFTMNKNSYSLNLSLGYSSASYFFNYYIAFILAFMSFYFLFKNKGRLWFLVGINIFLTLIVLIDLWYFRGFNTVPSIMIIKQTANLDNLSGSVLSMMSYLDFIFIIDLLLMLLLSFKFKNIYGTGKRKPIIFATMILLSTAFILYVPFTTNIIKKENSKSYLFGMYDPNDTSRFFSPIGYHVFNLYTVWRDSKPLELSEKDQESIRAWFQDKKEDLPDNEYKAMYKGKNLILIQVESLESFVINKSIQGKEITPTLNKLLNNSLYFPNINEQVNEGTSSDSDLMVNTSLYPLRQGSTFFSYPNTNYASLPNLLKEAGYSTTAIHPDKGAFWNWMEGLKGVGFEKLIDYYSFNIDETIGLGLSDGSYFNQIVPMLEKEKTPFYSFMVTLTSHGPFDLPEKYRELGLEGELATNNLGGYFESVHYTDKQLGIFLDNLNKKGILDNSVVVITGDHTGVHKYYSDKIAQLKNQEPWWNENTNYVPLIIYDKTNNNPKTFSVIGGQVDTMPTLCYIMGIEEEKYENSSMGRNLLNTKKSFAVLANRKYVGDSSSEEEKEKAIMGLDIADKLIKSNYFKNYYKK